MGAGYAPGRGLSTGCSTRRPWPVHGVRYPPAVVCPPGAVPAGRGLSNRARPALASVSALPYPFGMETEVRFEHVSFRYEESRLGEKVFMDITLDLPPGVISLVGQNGAGKTTFLLLAGGVLLPDQGKVFLRGIDTADS